MMNHVGKNIQDELEEKKKVENAKKDAEMLIAHIPTYRARREAIKIQAKGKEPAFIYNHFRGTLVHVCPKDEEQHWINLGYLITYYILDIKQWKTQRIVLVQ